MGVPLRSWVSLFAVRGCPYLRRKVDIYAQAVRGLLDLERDGRKRAKTIEFIDIYAGLTDNEFRRYRRQYPEESSTMAGVIERARDEGMRQGMQQGMRQGRVEGERTVLERLLRRRFGSLSPQIAERLSQASASELETWAENVLDAETLGDVFESSS